MRLVVVSNRLPVAYLSEGGTFTLAPTAGGVSVGLDALRKGRETVRVGWPGRVPHEHERQVAERLKREFACVPVFLPDPLVKGYYDGFSNRTLWPLFHSSPAHAAYAAEEWTAYLEANARFADKLASLADKGDTFWIHDYHLIMLPQMLRERVPNAKIGFFLHIPFPSYDMLRLLPWHKDILSGLAGADLVGFHTYDYAQAYLTCLRRLLGLDNVLGEVFAGGRAFQVDVFPMGIDFDRFARSGSQPAVAAEAARLTQGLGGRKLTLSLSRLDYTKGIPELLDALEEFLANNADWRGRFNHVMVVVPSRERVDRYESLKREIDERVGRLNGRFGTVDWTPVRYNYRYLPFAELAALYTTADVALITPSRDGMNLIAKEYLAARADGNGVLVLSEMAGAARELMEALIVNPNSRQEVARALREALEMPPAERRRRSQAMRARLKANDGEVWAGRFLGRLEEASKRSQVLAARRLTRGVVSEITKRFAASVQPLLLLDYDGTLVPFVVDPAAAAPDAELLATLRKLAGFEGCEVVIASGRDGASLQRWLGDLPITLVAEHGACVREKGSAKWEAVVRSDTAWKRPVSDVMGLFVQRIPGSFVEEKEQSLVWHWRGADRHVGTEASRELVEALTAITANTELVVLAGHRVVEAKASAASKGPYFVNRLAPRGFDFVLAVGDDVTDETLFRVLPPTAYSVRVGFTVSAARFNVEGCEEVRRLLEELAATPRARAPGAAPPA